MYRLVEAIKVENRRPCQIHYHNQRFNDARRVLFGKTDSLDLEKIISIPGDLSVSTYKLRIVTDGQNIEQELIPYCPKTIRSLKVVVDNEIDYTYKTENRLALENAYAQRGQCDDIIIVKNGLISDSFSANILLFNGKEWHTPDSPLLKGTQRAFLLDSKKVFEKKITIDMIYDYCSLKLVNAMIDFEHAVELKLPECVVQ